MRKPRKAGPSLLALLSIVIAASPMRAQSPIGHVVDLKGDWYLYADSAAGNPTLKLAQWQDVPAGGVIRIQSPSTDNYITVVDPHLNIIAQRKCENLNTCYQPIFLPRTLKETGPADELASLARKAWTLLWGEPYQQSFHRVRGVAPRLAEGVAPVVNGRVDLREVMQHVPNGRYSLAAYQKQAAKHKHGEATAFDWDPETTTAVSIGNRKPGLYEISSLEPADESLPSAGVSVRVLLCAPQQYSRALASFQKAQGQTDQWANATAPETIHVFLRAYLTELAKAVSPSKKP